MANSLAGLCYTSACMAARRASPIQAPQAKTPARKPGRAAPARPARDELRQPPGAPQTMLALQRRIGNRAVQRLVRPQRRADEHDERGAQSTPGPAPIPLIQAAHSPLGVVQRKSALVSTRAHTRKFRGARTGNGGD